MGVGHGERDQGRDAPVVVLVEFRRQVQVREDGPCLLRVPREGGREQRRVSQPVGQIGYRNGDARSAGHAGPFGGLDYLAVGVAGRDGPGERQRRAGGRAEFAGGLEGRRCDPVADRDVGGRVSATERDGHVGVGRPVGVVERADSAGLERRRAVGQCPREHAGPGERVAGNVADETDERRVGEQPGDVAGGGGGRVVPTGRRHRGYSRSRSSTAVS